jgi:hypothetical protein
VRPLDYSVFSGAGISAAAPASCPLGNELRDGVLALMRERATRYAPQLYSPREDFDDLLGSRKLEQILGRLWRVLGPEALDCLLSLKILVPNEAHMLAALHLARGGTHVSVNLDRGIEHAYALISGERRLSGAVQGSHGALLKQWQAIARGYPVLLVVASRREFEAWAAAGRLPALLKLHGSLDESETRLIDVVVEDTEALGGLSLARRAAVETLGAADQIMVAGYGGLDPDVYHLLLHTAEGKQTTWASKETDPRVAKDCEKHAIELHTGTPNGLATTSLREVAGTDLPWPESPPVAPGWRERFDRWAQDLIAGHDDAAFATAWAWLLADIGQRDRAAEVLAEVLRRDPSDAARLRLADVLYDDGHRAHASRAYASLVLRRRLHWPTRAHCLLRLAGIARGFALRRGHVAFLLGVPTALALTRVVRTVQDRRGTTAEQETTAAADAIHGHTLLRAAERIAANWPPGLRRLTARLLRRAATHCEEGARISANGNRRALANTHRLTALALLALIETTPPDPSWREQLEQLADSYTFLGDMPGAGNCIAALAIIARSSGEPTRADELLADARTAYTEHRADGRIYTSGAALIDRLTRIFNRQFKTK